MMGRAGRAAALLALPALVALLTPASVAAQGRPAAFGVVGGYTRSEHIWNLNRDVERTGGVIAGAFLESSINRWFSVAAEGAYTQRGSDIALAGVSTPGRVRTDNLTMTIAARGGLPLGPARLYVAAGPAADMALRLRLDPVLNQVFTDERTVVWGVHAGAGVRLEVAGRAVVEVEARIVEGLQSLYTAEGRTVHTRSRELVVRLGMFRGR